MKNIYQTIVVLLFVFAFTSCGSKTKESLVEAQQEEGVALDAAQFENAGIVFGKIELKKLSTVIAVNGVLDVPPQNLVSVSAIMGGFIKSTELLQGMQVKKGQLIATIQNPEFIKIQSQYLENKQKLKFLELEYKRQEELSNDNVSATKIFQQVSSDYNSLLATLGGLEEQLEILAINPATLTQSTIRSVVSIYAPIGGYVTVVNVNVGRFVNPQDVICEIVDTEHLHAELTVFEKDITKIKKGQKVRFVLVNESDKERTGFVFLINHKISEERTIRVHTHLDKEDPMLMPNMYLKAFIEVGEYQATALPDDAIVNAGEKEYIFVKVEGKKKGVFLFKEVEVQKGVSQNGYTEVILPERFDSQHTAIVIKGAYELLSKMNNKDE